jgi:hypothetical protein
MENRTSRSSRSSSTRSFRDAAQIASRNSNSTSVQPRTWTRIVDVLSWHLMYICRQFVISHRGISRLQLTNIRFLLYIVVVVVVVVNAPQRCLRFLRIASVTYILVWKRHHQLATRWKGGSLRSLAFLLRQWNLYLAVCVVLVYPRPTYWSCVHSWKDEWHCNKWDACLVWLSVLILSWE